jgi:hypothetical protein
MFNLKILFLGASVCMVAPFVAEADLDLNYTVYGNGGLSQPIAGLSDAPFWWVDTTGNVTAPDIATQYGYQVAESHPSALYPGIGSLLLSSAFELNVSDTLSVTVDRITNEYTPGYDSTFAVLLENGQLRDILYEQTDTLNEVGDTIILGGIQYGPCHPVIDGCIATGSSGWQTFSVTPGAGTYQLLFGALDTNTCCVTTALAIGPVRVPEPRQEELLALSLAILFCLLGTICYHQTRAQ